MYKHLTPQEIGEFEKGFEHEWDDQSAGRCCALRNHGGGCDCQLADILSFIDTLIGKRVGEIEKLKGKPNHNELFFMGACLDCGREINQTFVSAKITQVADETIDKVLSIFSPDSPKRNEEHDRPSQ